MGLQSLESTDCGGWKGALGKERGECVGELEGLLQARRPFALHIFTYIFGAVIREIRSGVSR